MKNPWQVKEPFDPMYDEEITITGNRTEVDINQSLKVIIFSDITGDGLSDSSINTEREDIVIQIQPSDYGYIQKIKRGDSIFRPFNHKNYKVQDLKNDIAVGWIIKAREV